MNRLVLSLLLGSGVAVQVACAQNQPHAPAPEAHVTDAPSATHARETEQSTWQKFDLDFPGGSPRDLISAIEKATGKPLNVLIHKEDETVVIPPMKFKAVTIPDLFSALRMSSQRQERRPNGVFNASYTFETQGHDEGAIFYFKCFNPLPPQEFCRFYQLGEDLQNYSIEDITTAIQTGWKMLGVKSTPQLKFHPETKLLIAVGPMEQLSTIDDVLKELRTTPRLAAPPKKDAAPAKQ